MKLVERHIVKDNRFEDICFKSGLLYNYVLYLVRQGIFNKEYLKEYDLSTKLGKENQFDFRNLPTAISQQVISQVFSNIKVWIKSKKDFEKNPSKFRSKPKLPKYKKGEKQNMVVFTTSACRVKKDDRIYFVKNIVPPIKTKIGDNKLCQVRIVPQATCYVVEVIYEKKEQDLNLNKDNVLSIDLGLNNLCTCINNVEKQPFIVNGRIMKSFNQWYNKRKAKLMSFAGDKGTSKRLRRLNNYRNFWIEDHIHKVSRFIINYCVDNNIGSLVVGLNKGWKQEINLGKKTNQKFVEIPFSRLIDKISYKCKLVGISFYLSEESYTSKVDHLAFEELGKHDVYLGKRKKRGLFQSSVNKLINADINGTIGIGRKVFGDSYVSRIIDSGLAFNPIKVSIV
ncbi:MAG: RuvC nuclease domain [Bacteriophage sp.]|nr:MAG: RuvC nuclease domain [Bacteriophage sp.]